MGSFNAKIFLQMRLFPAKKNIQGFAVYRIDLNTPPVERWKKLASDMKPQISKFLEAIRNNTNEIFGSEIFRVIDNYIPLLTKTLPQEYYEEIIGISEATELSVGEVTIYNIFYEFHSLCTSIVMRDVDNKMYHGRNLDFGLFLGWDVKNKTWLVAELLRPLIVKVEFERAGQPLYTSVSFAGYTGVLTGIKKNLFSLSVNERFKLNGGLIGIIEWIFGRRNQQWNGILTRQVMEKANSYNEAQKLLSSPHLLAPCYFILTGTKPDQGCVITRGRHDFDMWSLADEKMKNTWYLVQTNYDHWKKPPSFDDRSSPATICLELLGRQDAIYSLYNVLSTIPVLNKLTVYTAIMDPLTGDMKLWLQKCEDPCWPW
ncbi:acid ceramidase-like isoform X2 [Planococcus citri]|uniref:acid ceramidase-like isoform X2 n=1 Tax=Planococcus citri TaxID=170843 RepID=UPI0031F9A0F4